MKPRPPYSDLGGKVAERFKDDSFGMFKGRMTETTVEVFCYMVADTDEATGFAESADHLFGGVRLATKSKGIHV